MEKQTQEENKSLPTAADILSKFFFVDTKDIDDLRLALVLNPDSDRILAAMEEYRNLPNEPSIDDAGVAAVRISETLNPKLTAQEQALFVAGFQECIKWLNKPEPSINIRSISEKWVGIWQRGENPNLFQCVDEAIKEALKVEPSIQEDEAIAKEYATGMMGLGEYNEKWDYEDQVLFNTIVKAVKYGLQKTQPQPLQEDCTCTTDQTTGHTAGKCNVCGKEDLEEAAIQHADSLHKKGSSELAGNGKLTENDCWENAYFNFKEGSKVKKVEVK